MASCQGWVIVGKKMVGGVGKGKRRMGRIFR